MKTSWKFSYGKIFPPGSMKGEDPRGKVFSIEEYIDRRGDRLKKTAGADALARHRRTAERAMVGIRSGRFWLGSEMWFFVVVDESPPVMRSGGELLGYEGDMRRRIDLVMITAGLEGVRVPFGCYEVPA